MRWSDWWPPFSQVHRWIAIISFAVIGLLGLEYGTWTASHPQHLVWGSFTQTSQRCDGKDTCTALGTWVSTDGTRHLLGVSLDGDPVGNGAQVSAALDTNDDHDVVHTAWGNEVRTWLGWGVAAGGLALAAGGWWWTRRHPEHTYLL